MFKNLKNNILNNYIIEEKSYEHALLIILLTNLN